MKAAKRSCLPLHLAKHALLPHKNFKVTYKYRHPLSQGDTDKDISIQKLPNRYIKTVIKLISYQQCK